MQNTQNTQNMKTKKITRGAYIGDGVLDINTSAISSNKSSKLPFYAMSQSDVLRTLGANQSQGLSEVEARKRLTVAGANKLREGKRKSLLTRFIEQFADFMIIILLAAAAISFITAVVQGESRTDFLDPVIILCIITINAIVGVMQEFKAEKSIEELKKLTAAETFVIRDGQKRKISAESLVPGDIIVLEAGDSVPADARILHNLSVSTDESSLTGESEPVLKDEGLILPPNAPLGDRKNMVYMSGVVTSGKCTAVVIGTGMNTEVGKIAEILTQTDETVTPLQARLAKTGKILGITALAVCAFIFVLGIARNMPVMEIFMLSISLAVAAMPEGLPAIVTIVLAVGVQRMAKSNAIIRKLSAVETLGCATVICSDKTGTLTQNKMTVTDMYVPNGNGGNSDNSNGKNVDNLLRYAALCNNASFAGADYVGDPTETALCAAAHKRGITKTEEDSKYPRVSELPFDSVRKCMSTVHTFSDGHRVITKGAPEILINKCAYYLENGKRVPLTSGIIAKITAANEEMARNALRVIAVAYKPCVINSSSRMSARELSDLESDLIFCGLIGMIDPPRPEAITAVQACKTAGIKPVMITGDHKITAMAIAEKIGIFNRRDNDKVATGAELDLMSDETLREDIYSYSVFARVSPEHKARIVSAFKSRGNVVAMTGDGVNDAPSLKIADMGCAMGQTGTDVARKSADMILVDDNFSTIVEAVRQGRGIYDNIRKAVHFLLSSNFGEILTILAAFLLGFPTPLLAIHLLWVNFVTDSLPAIALSAEPPSDNIMRRPPINARKSLFVDGLGLKIIFEGFLIGSLTLLAFVIGLRYFDLPIARTMAFMTLGTAQLVHAYNMRSHKSLFKIGVFSNKKLNLAFVSCLLMQIGVVVITPLSNIFRTTALPPSSWVIVALLSIAPLVILELQKMFVRD